MSGGIHLKAVLVISTSIIFIFGLSLAILSIFMLYDQINILELVPPELYRVGLYLMAFSGIYLSVVCFLSFAGACLFNRFFVILACGMEIIIMILLIIAVIFVLLFERSMDNQALQSMENSLHFTYGRINLITRAWDETQVRLRCCAAADRGWATYSNSYWSNFTNLAIFYNSLLPEKSPLALLVPESCCYRPVDGQTGWPSNFPIDTELCQQFQFGPPRFKDGAHNSALNYRGCFNCIISFVTHYSYYLSALAIATIIILFGGVFASCYFLVTDIGENHDKGE